jgi:hypothetical protein
MAGAAAEEQMHSAVATRDIIGQAKGILMHRDNLTGLQAFAAAHVANGGGQFSARPANPFAGRCR